MSSLAATFAAVGQFASRRANELSICCGRACVGCSRLPASPISSNPCIGLARFPVNVRNNFFENTCNISSYITVRTRSAFMELELLEPPALNHSVAESVVPSRTLERRDLRRDDFWSVIPAYAATPADEFHTHTFQARQSVTNVRQLRDALRHLVPDSFYAIWLQASDTLRWRL